MILTRERLRDDPNGQDDDNNTNREDEKDYHPPSGEGVTTSNHDNSFDFGDIDEGAVLAEGEKSPEEEDYERLEALRANSYTKKKNGEVLGVEFGLDESVLYEVPRERWKNSGYREKNLSGKAWRRTQDRKKRLGDENNEAVDNEYYGHDSRDEISVEEYYEGDDFDFGGPI